ncbi:MAG: DNA topoisomerase [Lachnospiraceae bacterium]
MKKLIIAEKPSVARQYADALCGHVNRREGYLESDEYIITWCIGHLVTMSYPESYDPEMKKWSAETLPFIPEKYKYEVIKGVGKQFKVVKELLRRTDVDVIYYAGDSGREGEYIQRLIREKAGHNPKAEEKRIWISSMTPEAIREGMASAKYLKEYDAISEAAYLRAIEDWLIGINFSRAVTLAYGNDLKYFLNLEKGSIAVGRVMICLLGMVVDREREIRNFSQDEFFRIRAFSRNGAFSMEWRARDRSQFYKAKQLYQDIAFRKKKDADRMTDIFNAVGKLKVTSSSVYEEQEAAPYLYNLADLQDECSLRLKISPDKTLQYLQSLYEQQLISYPRTDARVLSSAIAEESRDILEGLCRNRDFQETVGGILDKRCYASIRDTRYVNDGKITDHYAIIPTGKLGSSLAGIERIIYSMIVNRYLAVFMDAAEYKVAEITAEVMGELFGCRLKALICPGFKEKDGRVKDTDMLDVIAQIEPGMALEASFEVKPGETVSPARYTSGSLIIAMERVGSRIEDVQLRASIAGCGIGTPATRAEIIKKLISIEYIALDVKTQQIKTTLKGELVYELLQEAAAPMLDPQFTAGWERGLLQIEAGVLDPEKYREKLYDFIRRRTELIKQQHMTKKLLARWEKLRGDYQ